MRDHLFWKTAFWWHLGWSLVAGFTVLPYWNFKLAKITPTLRNYWIHGYGSENVDAYPVICNMWTFSHIICFDLKLKNNEIESYFTVRCCKSDKEIMGHKEKKNIDVTLDRKSLGQRSTSFCSSRGHLEDCLDKDRRMNCVSALYVALCLLVEKNKCRLIFYCATLCSWGQQKLLPLMEISFTSQSNRVCSITLPNNQYYMEFMIKHAVGHF